MLLRAIVIAGVIGMSQLACAQEEEAPRYTLSRKPTLTCESISEQRTLKRNTILEGPENPEVRQQQLEADQRERDKQLPKRVSVRGVTFHGLHSVSASVQRELAGGFERKTFDDQDWVNDLRERTRDASQQKGFFWAEVQSDVRVLGISPSRADVEVEITVREGQQYGLKEIQWENVAAFPQAVLRELFPIKDGEVFNVRRIRTGLEELRKLYGSNGYFNFAAVPETSVNEINRSVILRIDLDGGAQFRFKSVDFVGLDLQVSQELNRRFPLRLGDPVNVHALEEFLIENKRFLPPDTHILDHLQTKVEHKTCMVEITLDFRARDRRPPRADSR